MNTTSRSRALALAGLTLAIACQRHSFGADSVASSTATDTSAGVLATIPDSARMTDSARSGANGASGTLSPANIASMVGLTNAGEIGAAQIAVDKATNGDIKAFAKMMITDHQAMQKSLDSLAQAKHLTPTPPAQADQQRQTNDQTLAQLNGAPKGKEFDSAYITSQVDAHQKALADVQSFAGATSDQDLRALLEQASTKVKAHLDRAQQIQTSSTRGKP